MNVKYGIQNEFRIFYLIHCRMRKMGMTKKNQVMPDKVLSKEFEEDRIGIFYKRPPYNWGKSNCERLCKLNCVMLYSHSISSVGERPAPRGGTTRPDECKITTI